jgi:hypothetical protein
MTTETKIGIRYEYKCPITDDLYVEQRKPEEPQFITISAAGAEFVLVNQVEFTYEQEVLEEIIEEPAELTE